MWTLHLIKCRWIDSLRSLHESSVIPFDPLAGGNEQEHYFWIFKEFFLFENDVFEFAFNFFYIHTVRRYFFFRRNKFSVLEVSTFWKKFTVGSTLSSFNFPSLFRFSLRQSYLWYCSSLQTNVYRKFDMIILKYGFLFQMKFHWVSLMNTTWNDY